uniref:Uncharacterized protein n=1 Tax=Staphylococcus pseudintermedius TaxID=283734 RepID=A0A346TP51_STAPS|nr:hypothetical protein [Staphylococcus pseudintermedius]
MLWLNYTTQKLTILKQKKFSAIITLSDKGLQIVLSKLMIKTHLTAYLTSKYVFNLPKQHIYV